MYNAYFKLSCSPFENTLDQRFLFMSECHREVIAALLYFAREKKSFAMVCGDVGTGKTMIVHHFLGKLPPSVQPILIPYPDVEYIEILRYIARVLRVDTEAKGVLELSDDVKAALTKAGIDGKQVVLIIDEAHLLPVSSLENIRLLSNIELTENKLLQILLIGQNELALKLRKRELRQLRQRININRVLSPMNPAETVRYIDHRLKVAGSGFDACFEPGCRKLIYEITGGVPRSINRLCDTALIISMTQKCDKVTRKILKKAHAALESDSLVSPEVHPPAPPFHFKKLWPAFAAAALVLLVALGLFGYRENFGRYIKASVHGTVARKEVGAALPKHQVSALEAKAHDNPASKAGANSSPAAPPGHEETPSPVSSPVSAAPRPGKAQTVSSMGMGATANQKVSLPGKKSIPAPPAAKETVPEHRIQDKKPQSATPPQKSTVTDVKTVSAGAAHEGRQAAKPAPGRPDFIVVTVKKGDSLSRIAAKWFPEDPKSGLKWIVAANPQIHDKNRILADQTLKIPRKNYQKTGE